MFLNSKIWFPSDSTVQVYTWQDHVFKYSTLPYKNASILAPSELFILSLGSQGAEKLSNFISQLFHLGFSKQVVIVWKVNL